jgi:hypothetical protein
MDTNGYSESIVRILKGQTAELQEFKERLDWSGSGAVLEMYNSTSGVEREQFISALGQIIEEGEEPAPVIAQLIHIASSLNITQIEPSIRKLKTRTVASEEPVRGAIQNFLAYRNLRVHGIP